MVALDRLGVVGWEFHGARVLWSGGRQGGSVTRLRGDLTVVFLC